MISGESSMKKQRKEENIDMKLCDPLCPHFTNVPPQLASYKGFCLKKSKLIPKDQKECLSEEKA